MDTPNTRFRGGRINDLDSVAVFGPFDFTDPGIEALAKQGIAAGRKDFVFDFSKVTYLTSPGISSIIRVLKRVQAVGGTLFLYGASQDMLDLLNLANIMKYLKILEAKREP
jgi:anti-anti-sigma factor